MEIKRDELLSGARLATQNGREFLESSLLSLDGGLLRPAAATFALGIQEIGKAKMLADAHLSGASAADVDLYSHRAKVAAAEVVLGSSILWLQDPAFQASAFQASAFQFGVRADEPTRLEVTYVNHGSTGWKVPPVINPADLREHIDDAVAKAEAFELRLST